LVPYAYISASKVNAKRKVYSFDVVYWGKEGGVGDRLDEGTEGKLV
jgi:hypothetical protein